MVFKEYYPQIFLEELKVNIRNVQMSRNAFFESDVMPEKV